jgi:hypothetical protein
MRLLPLLFSARYGLLGRSLRIKVRFYFFFNCLLLLVGFFDLFYVNLDRLIFDWLHIIFNFVGNFFLLFG